LNYNKKSGVNALMKINLIFGVIGDKILQLKRRHQYQIQAMVYNLLNKEYAHFLHNEGFIYEGKRHFKLFCFSKLFGNGPIKREKDFLYIPSPVKLSITSPVNSILEQLANNALSLGEIRLGNNFLQCKEVTVENPQAESEEILVQTLSPIVCYSTLKKYDGSDFTHYHSPYDQEFGEQIHANLIKKFTLITSEKSELNQTIKIEKLGRIWESIRFFSPEDNRPIKGWNGNFRLTGSQELLQTALDAGLGAKNSSGFGCVELIR